jgi:hypothetical protein
MPTIGDREDERDTSLQGETASLVPAVASAIAGLAGLLGNPAVGAAAAATAFIGRFSAGHRWKTKIEAMIEGFRRRFEEVGGRLDRLEAIASDPLVEDVLSAALVQTMLSPRVELARRYGRVLGATLAADAPRWEEAGEFIRDLERLTDDDLRALSLLWRVQQAGQLTDGEMSTDANHYTSTWTEVLSHVGQARITRDDWYSRCGRLVGFGLANEVQRNPTHQSPSDACFRITGRAVRLMSLLGEFEPAR